MASQEEFQNLAQQLRKPEGKKGQEIALMMQETNAGMTEHALRLLEIRPGDEVLELGPGNGQHVASIFRTFHPDHYEGLDISQTMIRDCLKFNKELVRAGKARFTWYDGRVFPLENNSVDKIFTVNTVYFWENPRNTLEELDRVLRPGGRLNLTFGDRSFMETLPFTKFGFSLYDPDALLELVGKDVYENPAVYSETESFQNPQGEELNRKFWTVSLTKK